MDNLQSVFAQPGQYVPTQPSAGVTADSAAARTAAAVDAKTTDNTTFHDVIGAQMVKGPMAWIDRTYEMFGVPRDPEFFGDALKPHQEKWAAAGLDTHLLERATSAEGADLLYGFAMQNKMADEDIAHTGMLEAAAAGALDPIMTGAGLVTGGLGYAAKAGRVANALRAGAVNGALGGTAEALSSQYNPEITGSHIALAVASNAALGGLLGARKGELAEQAFQAKKILRSVDSVEAAKRTGTDAMGAQRVPGSNVPTVDGPAVDTPEWKQAIKDEAALNPRQVVAGKVRRDIAGRVLSSKSNVFQHVWGKVVRDSVGDANRSVATKFTASEEAELLDQTIHAAYRKGVEGEWQKFSSTNGIRGDAARANFNESVGYHIRGVAKDMTPEVSAVAKHAEMAFKTMNDELRAAGVPGFERELSSTGYLPRIFSAKGYTDLAGTKGLAFDNIRDNLVKPAMRSAWSKNLAEGATVDEDLLSAVSEAWLTRGYNKAMGGAEHTHGTLGAADASSVRELLTEAGVDPQRMEVLLGKMEKGAVEKATHARAKSRIDIDESFGATLTDDLGNTHQVHLADLLENNVDKMVPEYIREMSGWAMMKKHVNVGTQGELDALKAFTLRESKMAGDSDMTRLVDIMSNSVLGHSTSDAPHSAWTRGSRLIRGHNFLTTMGEVGYTMVEGIGGTIGAVGFRNALKATPAAWDMVRNMRTGKFSTDEARFISELSGFGSDFIRNQPHLRLDAVGESVWTNTTAVGRTLNTLDKAQQYAQRAMSVVSGIAPMQQFNHGLAGTGITSYLIDIANRAKVSGSIVNRLRAGGLDAADQARLFSNLKGLKGVKDIAGKWDKWSPEDKRLLALFVHRNAKRYLGEGALGDTIQLMHSATGRIFTQFRTFQSNSYTAVLLHGLHMRDWQTAQMWMGSTLFAGVGMAARNYVNTIGDPEKRAELMTTEVLSKQAFQQSSYSSIIPFMIDTVAHDMKVKEALGGDDKPVFAYGRSTGLNSGVSGIPTLSTANSAWSLLALPGTALNPHKSVTEKQVRDASKLLWFQNITGVRNGMNFISKQFPKSEDD